MPRHPSLLCPSQSPVSHLRRRTYRLHLRQPQIMITLRSFVPSFSFQLAMLPSVIVGEREGIGKFEAAHCDGVLLKPGCTISNCPAVRRRLADILKLLVSVCALIEPRTGTPGREKTWRRPISGMAETKVATTESRQQACRSGLCWLGVRGRIGICPTPRAGVQSSIIRITSPSTKATIIDNRTLHRANSTFTTRCNSGASILAI